MPYFGNAFESLTVPLPHGSLTLGQLLLKTTKLQIYIIKHTALI